MGVAGVGVDRVAVVINQLFGPVVNLVGDGGYSAWTVGTWLVVKGANVVLYGVVALVFLLGAFINSPEHHQDHGEDRS